MSSSPLSFKKQVTSDLHDNQYRIFAVVQAEVTQKFISPQYLKFDLCDTGVLFYQLSNQVNWELNHGMGVSEPVDDLHIT